jgi:hypothetical protein
MARRQRGIGARKNREADMRVGQFNTKRVGLKILPIKLPTVHVAASIVTIKNRTLSPTAKLFINCVRDVARSISAQN